MPRWNGWGADIENSRFQPGKVAGLKKDDVPKLKLKWAFAVPNATAMYGQPAIAGGRLFVGSDNAVVYALNAESGLRLLVVPGRGGRPHRDQRRGDHGPTGRALRGVLRRPQRRQCTP